MDTNLLKTILSTWLVYIQIGYDVCPRDKDIVPIAFDILEKTEAVPLEYANLILGLDCHTLIFKTNDIESAIEQLSAYRQEWLESAKLSYSSQVIVFDDPSHLDFDHLYIGGTPTLEQSE